MGEDGGLDSEEEGSLSRALEQGIRIRLGPDGISPTAVFLRVRRG